MKIEVTFYFIVEYSIKNASECLGKTPDEIEELDNFELMDLFAANSYGLSSGDASVDDEYYDDPEYDDWGDELFARFCAKWSVITEGANEDECTEKAKEIFYQKDFGDYEYADGFDYDYSITVKAE